MERWPMKLYTMGTIYLRERRKTATNGK